MVNVTSKRCLESNCNRRPVFNLLNEKDGIYCSEHKKENMIDVKNRKCKETNCNKIPSCNLPNETSPIYCSEYKKENMINVISKRCLESNCNKQPKYNLSKFQDFGNRPIVFIRFNPDSYIKDDKKISSSFKMHKTLDVREPKEWKQSKHVFHCLLRLDLLKETINKFLNEIPEKEVTNDYLFYDQ